MKIKTTKMKTISFEEYALAKIGNENKSYNDIFNIAWKNSEEGLRRKRLRQNTLKALSVGCFSLIACGLFLNPTTKAFADVLGMEALAKNEPRLATSLKYACEFYKDCIDILGLDQSVPLFMEIVKKCFSEGEIAYLVESAKGLSLEEILQIVPTL